MVCYLKTNKTSTHLLILHEIPSIEYLKPEATKAILSAFSRDTSKHRRNRMILILMYDSGCRVQEIADLKVSSLHLDVRNPYMTVIGKGRKIRNVHVDMLS